MGRARFEPHLLLLALLLSFGCPAGSGADAGDREKEAALEDVRELAVSAYAARVEIEAVVGCSITTPPPLPGEEWKDTGIIAARLLEPLRESDEDFFASINSADVLFVFGVRAFVDADRTSDTVVVLARPYTETLETECENMGAHLSRLYSPNPWSALTLNDIVAEIAATELEAVSPIDPRTVFRNPVGD